MKKRLVKRLIFRIVAYLIICVMVNYVIDLTISAPIENSIAIEQLNGGGSTSLLMQAFYKYKSIVHIIGAAINCIAAIPVIKTTIKLVKEINNELNKGE